MGLVTSKRKLIDAEAEGTHVHPEFTNPIRGSTRMPFIPNEIIIEILSRLPAMSLLRFRCVCKSWLSLIANKKFIRKHLHMSTRDDDNDSLQRVIFECGLCFISCSLDSIYYDLCLNPITLDHRLTIKEPILHASMVGSCDGLVCISTNGGIYLWNPLLRESWRLPRFKVDLSPNHYSLYGFGYDYSSDDYKVVAATFISDSFSDHCQVDVYALRSNSWRRIQAIPRGGGRIWSRGIFFNGALHWVLPLTVNTWTIIALDLATETYHEIAHPTDDGDFKYNRMLGVLGGCLCAMMSDMVGSKIIVWIMKEYGFENSWTELACFPIVAQRGVQKTIRYYPYNSPLFFSKTDEMLVIYKSMINLYNLKNKTSRSRLIRHSSDCIYSATYVESLVSLGVEDSVDWQPEISRKFKRRKK